MSYTILSARIASPLGEAVALRTVEAGEVHLDIRLAADDPLRYRPELRDRYEAWKAAGNTPTPFTPVVEDVNREIRRAAINTEAETNALINRLRDATPAQINTFVDNNLTMFTAQQRTVLAHMLIAIAFALNGGQAK